MRENYLGEEGCCMACMERGVCEEPCYNCKCRQCDLYVEKSGKCCIAQFPKEKVECPTLGESGGWVVVKAETDKAILLSDNLGNFPDAWFPKSKIYYDRAEPELSSYIKIPRWLMERKGWIKEDDWFELEGMSIKEYWNKRLVKKYENRHKL